jgi:hypothetical protein
MSKEKALALAAKWGIVGVTSDNLAQFYAEARAEGMREAIDAAQTAQLPAGYQWGRDAMESFNFGKERAATAIFTAIRSRNERPAVGGQGGCASLRRRMPNGGESHG